MNYYEFTFTYSSPIPASTLNDVLAEELGKIEFESFAQTDDSLLAYISATSYNDVLLSETLSAFPLENVEIFYTKRLIEGKDWNEEWERNYFQPIEIGTDCIVRASFHAVKDNFKYNIIIDPKMAFGTGNHATTYLMISSILRLNLEGKEILDMGCGTAVLAILAKQKGASRVVAIDIDPWAYDNALENIRLNQTNEINVFLGGAEEIEAAGSFDYIFANINRNILLQDVHQYSKALNPDGVLYMSGFYTEDIPLLEQECLKERLELIHSSVRDNWALMSVRKMKT